MSSIPDLEAIIINVLLPFHRDCSRKVVKRPNIRLSSLTVIKTMAASSFSILIGFLRLKILKLMFSKKSSHLSKPLSMAWTHAFLLMAKQVPERLSPWKVLPIVQVFWLTQRHRALTKHLESYQGLQFFFNQKWKGTRRCLVKIWKSKYQL